MYVQITVHIVQVWAEIVTPPIKLGCKEYGIKLIKCNSFKTYNVITDYILHLPSTHFALVPSKRRLASKLYVPKWAF